MAIRIKWSSLLQLDELEFIPDPPKVLEIDDKLLQSISWLTAATRHNRKLLRCDENGALLVTEPWNGLNSVEAVEREVVYETRGTYTPTVEHKGILVTTGLYMVKVEFTRIGASISEDTFVPASSYYWYPHPCTTMDIWLVPTDSGNDTFVGLTAFN